MIATKLTAMLLSVILFFTGLVSGIQGKFRKDDVVILYTNDVHCALEENIGYAGLAAYKKQTEAAYKNVTTVDVGDCTQGSMDGSMSKGSSVIEIMNYVGYDYAVLGNHEFDYGMEQLSKNIAAADFTYLGCNLTYSGSGENLLADVADYAIEDYGDVQVAFIGITTPSSITSSTPLYFKDENGNFIYGFEESLTESVQHCAVEARLKGADYVVVLSHLGDSEVESPYSSVELIENTVGIDAVLDGHDHNTVAGKTVANQRGEDVLLSSTGTKFQSIGKLVIGADGTLSTELVAPAEKDADTAAFIQTITQKTEAAKKQIVGHSEVTLSISDAAGIRMVRNRETAIANLDADAFRVMTGADIGMVNGGGVRADIKAGDITFLDIFNVNPFGNQLCVIEATGQQIADALEWTSRFVQSEYTDGTYSLGEDGGFLQVSGLKYTVDTSVADTCTADGDGLCTSVSNPRRVSNIQVLQNGTYVPLDMNKTYTVAGSAYILLNNGNGVTAFAGCKVIYDNGPLDYEVLMNYITDVLGGNITAAAGNTEGRITVK